MPIEDVKPEGVLHMEEKKTFCRICEPHCPMLVTVDRDEALSMRPDYSHPSGGVACHKGLSFLDVHADPDRLAYPRRRKGPKSCLGGSFEDVSWDFALNDISGKLAALLEKYGPNSIAVYTGNPLAFDSRGATSVGDFVEKVGTQMRFSANPQDAQNKCLVACEIYGSPLVLTVPDLYETDYLLCIGANPVVSRWTTASIPQDSGKVLDDIRGRRGKIRFVNPRCVESSRKELDEMVLIKPGTDVYFLAALVDRILEVTGRQCSLVEIYGKNFDHLVKFVSDFPAQKVAHVTGVSAGQVNQIAMEILAADSAAFHLSTGVNQSGQGVLAYWLNEMLSLITGNLGKQGGNYKPVGFVDGFTSTQGVTTVETSLGNLRFPNPMGPMSMPGAILADLIEAGDIRALIVVSGNPLLSIGDENRTKLALEKLDILVSVDIFPSCTAELSDYMLPATDFLERADVALLPNMMQSVPYVQFTEAIVEPKYERRHIWWIFSELLQRLSLVSSDENNHNDNGFHLVDAFLAAGNLSVELLRDVPDSLILLHQLEPESFFERCLVHPDKRIDCCPDLFFSSGLFVRCEEFYNELEALFDQLMLITLRTPFMHNGWMNNVDKFRRGKHANNPLYINDFEAEKLDLVEGETVRVSSDAGSLYAIVSISNDLRPGVVAMSHGYGQGAASQLRVASQRPGVNSNRLAPTGWDSMEPLSYMSRLSAIPVTISKILTWED